MIRPRRRQHGRVRYLCRLQDCFSRRCFCSLVSLGRMLDELSCFAFCIVDFSRFGGNLNGKMPHGLLWLVGMPMNEEL